MRVLCVCDEDIRKERGTKVCVIEITQNLVKLGNQVLVVVPGYLPRNRSYQAPSIVYVPTFRKNVFSFIIYELLKIPYLTFHILRFKPDVVYLMSGPLSPLALMVAFLLRVPSMLEMHGIAEDEFRKRGISEIVIKVLNMKHRVGFWLSSSIICVTEGIRNEVAKRYRVRRNKLVVIPNGANIELFKPLSKHACRQRLGLDKDSFYVGFIGSFAPWQGLDTLIQAAKLVTEEGFSHIKYVLLGDGELSTTLRQMVHELDVEKSVFFAGSVPYTSVVDYINASDVMVAPFSGKGGQALGSPLKLFEYLACGRPVIASRMDGVTHVVEEGHCGHLIGGGDVQELANAIIQSYNEQDELKQLGENGRKLVEAKYSWRTITQETLRTLEGVARKKKRVAKCRKSP